MKAPRLGCERPAGEHDNLEFADYLDSLLSIQSEDLIF